MVEIWRPIPNYEGYYEASNLGRIRSIYRYKRVLKPMISNTGYERVDLFKNRHRRQYSVHRLVAITFIDNSDDKPFVNHKDENKLNNRASNLEWVTHVENCNYGTAIKRRVLHTDYSNRHSNLNQIKAASKPISQYTKDGQFIRNWSSASECSRATGLSVSSIRSVANGKRNSLFGYVFKKRGDDLSRK